MIDMRDDLVKEYTLDKLSELKRSFNTGKDPGAVLHAIYLAFGGDVPVPSWAQREFRRVYAGGLHGRRQEWFRPPNTKAQADRYLRYVKAMPKVWRLVSQITRTPPNASP